MHSALLRPVPIPLFHYRCRSSNPNNVDTVVCYSFGKGEDRIMRPIVADDKVHWNVPFDEYERIRIAYTASTVCASPTWADPPIPSPVTKWNKIDGGVDRRSYHGVYDISLGYPLNPVGRTGIYERGILGRWGPNHIADAVITRFKMDENNQAVKDPNNNENVWQILIMETLDDSKPLLPTGFCDIDQKLPMAFYREILDELNLIQDDVKREEFLNKFEKLFDVGREVYRGYVDDPRNTDNGWIETVCYHFHDEDGSVFNGIKLKKGGGALNLKWVDYDKATFVINEIHDVFVKEALKIFQTKEGEEEMSLQE